MGIDARNVRRPGQSVLILNDAGEEVIRLNFKDAWSAKWSNPNLNSEDSDIATESLHIALAF